MSAPNRQPASWADYERGRSGSVGSDTGSQASRVHWAEEDDEDNELGNSPTPRAHGYLSTGRDDKQQDIRRRRSSMSMRIDALRHAGGVNSIDNFARSWQRAVGFHEITPVRPSFKLEEADEEPEADFQRRPGDEESTSQGHRSLLREALENEDCRSSEQVIADEDREAVHQAEGEPLLRKLSRQGSLTADNIFTIEPSLASPFGASYGTTYGSLASRVNESSMRHAGRLFTEQQVTGVQAPDKEREPLLVKKVEQDDGKFINVVVGRSTLPQTIFNSVNVLIGIGILSLPLALKYSGWVIGVTFFIFSAITTQYTAKLLAKCLDLDGSLVTFADLAYISFGPRARVATSILFSLELVAACVALVVLFADSLDALVPGFGVIEWKIVCGLLLIPLGFLPLRLLSFTSILGILCCFGIVVAVLIDGLIKPHAPGSLREPAKTYLFPEHWGTLPLSFGLLMSPWGGHSVFPNIYRDMRHPYKYRRGVNYTYIFTFFLDFIMAVVGLLMFGNSVRDEITSNIVLLEDGYPKVITVFIVVCVAIIPLTKTPLNARPIVSTIEILCGLDPRALAATPELTGMSGYTRGMLKILIRVLTTLSFVVIAIIVPSFDRIMSLLGSVACFSICIILPLAFHIKLFGKEIPAAERTMNWTLMIGSTIMAVISTVFAFLPKELIGAK